LKNSLRLSHLYHSTKNLGVCPPFDDDGVGGESYPLYFRALEPLGWIFFILTKISDQFLSTLFSNLKKPGCPSK
jgi:hypothetical protein